MSISVKAIHVAIGKDVSNGFSIMIDGVEYYLDDFVLSQQLLSPSRLSFTMHRQPGESLSDTQFQLCSKIIGKEIQLGLETGSLETLSFRVESDITSDIVFKGIIMSAMGSRDHTEYKIHVSAASMDALLEDHPGCKSYENMPLDEIVSDVVSDYCGDSMKLVTDVRFNERIPYCVKYNESNYAFLQRLAVRYGEWMYNDGENLVFGQLPGGESVKLKYPSVDIPSYQVNLQMGHVGFQHVASSYNADDSSARDGESEMEKPYNEIGESVFEASKSIWNKPTYQHLRSGGFADADSRETVLSISTKSQSRGEKAKMQTYNGQTYCSKLKIGNTLIIVDNYLTDSRYSLDKSNVEQDEILIVGLTHYFSADETYRNTFTGIPSACDYPPYSDTDAYPVATCCRARVTDNEDPNNFGRVRVQFDWQREQDADMKTPWLRISQPYAGGGKGFSFIPEVGEEVMIDFEDGNADRPFVRGTLYNGGGMPDGQWLPEGNSRNQVKAIRTRNGHTIEIHDEGNDGYIRIYDNEKENYILTFSTDQKLIKLESTGNIELYAKNDIIMHAGHDINASADNDIFIAASHDMQRTADNDIREHAGNDRSTSIDRNDSLSVSENQFVQIGDNKDEQIEHKLQVTAENIREEARDQLLEYSTTHHMKAEDQMALNSGSRIDIKSGVVKVQ